MLSDHGPMLLSRSPTKDACWLSIIYLPKSLPNPRFHFIHVGDKLIVSAIHRTYILSYIKTTLGKTVGIALPIVGAGSCNPSALSRLL
jgi:hypothetical protein